MRTIMNPKIPPTYAFKVSLILEKKLVVFFFKKKNWHLKCKFPCINKHSRLIYLSMAYVAC
jgi:hypothetical protein